LTHSIVYMFKKLQFILTVNGGGSKTAKIIKGTINDINIDIQAMLVWLIVPFMIFAVFDPSPLTVCMKCSFFTYIVINKHDAVMAIHHRQQLTE